MNIIKLAIQGFIIGIGKIIPGVSGAMFAMMFGVYEKALKIISNLRKELKGNFVFTITLGCSVLLAIIFGSNMIKKSLDTYYMQTMFLFIGMMVAGIPSLFFNIKNKKISSKSKFVTIVIALILLVLGLVDINGVQGEIPKNLFSIVMLFVSGFLDALATIVPGVCGTALLMILGYYDSVISALGSLLDFSNIVNNLFVLIPFLIGMILGVIIVSKLINYLFTNYKDETYFTIFCFAIMSIFILFIKTIIIDFKILDLFISLVLFTLGFLIVRFLEKLNIK